MSAINLSNLSDFQKGILNEAMEKGNGTLFVPMGSGKTRITLTMALLYNSNNNDRAPSLVVAAKNVIGGWMEELDKLFPNVSYTFLHPEWHKDHMTHDVSGYEIVFTTPQVTSKHYEHRNIKDKLLDHRDVYWRSVIFYREPDSPFGGETDGPIYSTMWSSYFIDEGDDYLKHTAPRTRSLIGVAAKHRWLLTGTLFSEPKPDNAFGYFLLLNNKTTPRDKPTFQYFAKEGGCKVMETLVMRNINEDYIPEKLGQEVASKVISHTLTREEADLFLGLKDIIKNLHKKIEGFKNERIRLGDPEAFSAELKLLTGILLGMIGYIRQALICPIIPISSMYINMADLSRRDEVTTEFTRELMRLNPHWLEDERSVFSSRLRKVIELIESHPEERVVVFSDYRKTLDLLRHYIVGRKTFTILGSMSVSKKMEEIKSWEECHNSVLTLTYAAGGKGLNLQKGSVAIIMDYGWDTTITKQATDRIVRRGQQAKRLSIYYLTSNTGVERGIYNLHLEKKRIGATFIKSGVLETTGRLKLADMVQLIEMEDAMKILTSIYNNR